MKNPEKKLIAPIAFILCFVLTFLFFFTPGVLLGGINYISPESHVRVTKLTYTRISVDWSTVEIFDMTDRAEYELNAEQTAKLARLLRNSWYTRRFGSMVTYRVPHDVESYYHYFISISDRGRHVTLNFIWGGRVLRGSDEYNDWFRIRNSSWEEQLREILADVNRQ